MTAQDQTDENAVSAVDQLSNLRLSDGEIPSDPLLTASSKPKPKKGGSGNRKGANPLKARLKASSTKGGNHSPPTETESDDRHEGMQAFVATTDGPIMVLRFVSRAAQHRAMARAETYYESVDARLAGYQSWNALGKIFGEEHHIPCRDTWRIIADRHLCKGYEAFNLPVSAMRNWIEDMRAVEVVTQKTETEADDRTSWLKAVCLREEVQLLEHLADQGVIDLASTTPNHAEDPTQGKSSSDVQYLISTTSSSIGTALLHERLHALYHLSPRYASEVHTQYTTSLSKKSRKVVEHDLKMRGYRDSVWEDEWQAYLLGSSAGDAEGPGEATWGKGPREECLECRGVLRSVAAEEGKKFHVKMPW